MIASIARLGAAAQVAVVLATCALGGRTATADPAAITGPQLLARAQGALAHLRYEEAAALLDRAYAAGGNSPGELRRLFQLTGRVAVILGHDTRAELAFQQLLVLDPEAEMPDGTSPKILSFLDQARASLEGPGALAVTFVARPGPPAIVMARVQSDPLSMVAGLRASWRDDAGNMVHAGGAPGPLSLVVQLQRRSRVTLELLDGLGNTLVEGSVITGPGGRAESATSARIQPLPPRPGFRQEPGPAPGGDRPPGAAPRPAAGDPARALAGPSVSAGTVGGVATGAGRSGPSAFHRWPVWAGMTGGLAAVGLIFGLEARSARSTLDQLNADSRAHDYIEAEPVQSRLTRDSILADMSFGLAVASAAVAAVVWLHHHHDGDRGPSSWVAPGPGPAGATAGLGVEVWF